MTKGGFSLGPTSRLILKRWQRSIENIRNADTKQQEKRSFIVGDLMEFKGENSQLQVVSVKIYDIFVRGIKSNSRVVSERIFSHCRVVNR